MNWDLYLESLSRLLRKPQGHLRRGRKYQTATPDDPLVLRRDAFAVASHAMIESWDGTSAERRVEVMGEQDTFGARLKKS